jgi:hypothetical protein
MPKHHITVLLSLAALAAAVEVEPAKLATADAAPLDPGTWELALGASWTVADRLRDATGASQDRGGSMDERGLTMGLTYGIIDNLDAGVGVGWSRIEDTASTPDAGSGPTDVECGAKWRLWQTDNGESAWAIALLPGFTAPLGRGQDAETEIPTASRFWTAQLALAGSGNLGIISLNADTGYAHACGSESSREGYIGTLAASVAIGVMVTESIQPEVNLSWAKDRVEEGDAPWAVLVTVGTQIGLPFGRLGLGVQRVIDGAAVDVGTACIAELALSFE